MPSFENSQTRPFCFEPTEPSSPLGVRVERTDGAFQYKVDSEDWKFLEEILNSDFEFEPIEEKVRSDFWAAVLDYEPEDELEFVRIRGRGHPPIPLDVVTDWPENTEYEYDIWLRARQKYEKWLELYQRLELPSEISWSDEPPEARQLKQLEFELAQYVPDRIHVLKRLHALGIFAVEDDGMRAEHLESLGCERLVAWRRAALIHRWVSPLLGGMLEDPEGPLLASPVGVDWFLDGPYQQQYLDPLFHLKFALHEHLKREPPQVSSSFVVSMGGRISGAFFYQLGPGGVPQLVRGGEPPRSSRHFNLYQYKKTDAGDRFAELSGRYIRAGFPELGRALAASWLRREPAHGQCWVELGVSLGQLGQKSEGKACLEKAESLGHQFYKKGELAELWAFESDAEPPEPEQFLLDAPQPAPEQLHDLALTEEVWDEPCLAQMLKERVPNWFLTGST